MPEAGDVPDDASIPDESAVYRRITLEWYKVDPSMGDRRLTTAAFSDLGDAMSVAIGVDLEAGGHEPAEVVANHPGYGLVALPVDELRRLGLGVVRSAIDGEVCHGDVYGKKTRSTKKKLRDLAEQRWILKPASPDDDPEQPDADGE